MEERLLRGREKAENHTTGTQELLRVRNRNSSNWTLSLECMDFDHSLFIFVLMVQVLEAGVKTGKV